jgi:hypothetical protein
MKLIPSDPLQKILRTTEVRPDAKLVLGGARGETVSAQAVLMPAESDTVTAGVSELRSLDGKSVIPSGKVRLQWERYMDITKNTPGIPVDELVGKAPVSIPDPFWESAEREVGDGKPQPLWIELDIPADAAPGDYKGELTVKGKSGMTALPVSVHVRAFRMPEERHQRVIQWWDFPGRGFENLKPGTDEYWEFLTQCCKFLRSFRQTDVRVEWGLIGRTADGKGWDTSLFEKYAETAFNAGMQVVQFAGAGRHTKSVVEPDSRTETVEDNLGRLAAVQKVVERRGWQGRVLTSLADEPFIYQEESFRESLKRMRDVAPSVGVIEAVETDDIGDLDIYVPKLSHLNLWWPRYEELKREGRTVWFYTCCHPTGRYPNRFLDQPLVAARELHWISYLYDLDGYLHWGLNWFAPNEDPYTEKGSTPWVLPPGDSQVVYPGKKGWVGSLRLSAMRDGLQDYEYLWTLENSIRRIKTRLGKDAAWLDPRQRPTELCRRVVQSFYDHTRDPQVLLDTRSAIADEIEALESTPLLYVQTTPPDGTPTPAGPVMINVRGAVTPGSKVTINGQPVIPENITDKGYFKGAVFITKDAPDITVTAEFNGITRTAKRTFVVEE